MLRRLDTLLESKCLRRRASKVRFFDKQLQSLVSDMLETMRAAHGVGLAAPQIGVPYQIAVIEIGSSSPIILANPEIIRAKGSMECNEGCLSLPKLFGRTVRSKEVVVKAKDLQGVEQRYSACGGLFSQVLQHEIDHLYGLLFIKRVTDIDHDLRMMQ